MTTDRQENESYVEYLQRIVQMVRDKKIDYIEFGDCLLGEKNVYASDNLRKAFYVINIIAQNLEGDIAATDEIAEARIQAALEELKKERIKTQTVNVERSRIDRQEARIELYYENVGRLIQTMEVPDFEPVEEPTEGEHEYVLAISDIHCGATFALAGNFYSIEEVGNRFAKLTYKVLHFIEENDVKRLKVFSGGDDIQGMLRLNDLQLNQTAVSHATVAVQRFLAKFLKDVSVKCFVEFYPVGSSNHNQPRYLGSKANALTGEDVGYAINSYIKDVLADNERVTVNVIEDEADGFTEFTVCGYNVIGCHGHQIKNIESAAKDLSYSRKKYYQYVLMGHYHAGKEVTVGDGFDGGDSEVLICPSMIGTDPYAKGLMVGAKGSCKLYEFAPKEGHIASYKFILN